MAKVNFAAMPDCCAQRNEIFSFGISDLDNRFIVTCHKHDQ
jgi:hypothetical protein